MELREIGKSKVCIGFRQCACITGTFQGTVVPRVNNIVATGVRRWSHASPLCVVHCHPNSCIVIILKHDRSRVRVVGVGGVEKGKVGDMDCVIDRRGF